MRITIGLFLLLASLLLGCAGQEGHQFTEMKTEYTDTPLGIDAEHPVFSWNADVTRQTAYQVGVGENEIDLQQGENLHWDSQKVESDLNVGVAYRGPELESGQRYYWQVRVWNEEGEATEWSQPSWFEMGKLDSSDWQAKWISGPERRTSPLTPEEGRADDADIKNSDEFCRPVEWLESGFFLSQHQNNQGECREVRPAPMLRKSFELNKEVASARVYTSGLAYNDLTINGEKASEAVLDPGFTDYNKTVYYTTYDVTDLLQQDENVIATVLGSGQFDSSTQTWDWGWTDAEWRSTPQLLLQLEIQFEDGTEQVITTDETWKVSTEGPTRYDSYYLGETYDARREIEGWRTTGFDDAGWSAARVVEAPKGSLRAQPHEPVKIVDTLEPGIRTEPESGVIVYDIGQNLAGWVQINVDAPEGTAIELFYSEKLDTLGYAIEEGNALVGGQLQTDYYIASGSGNEQWTPRFTYKGFRYLMISGSEAEPLPEDVEVEVTEVQQLRTGYPETSNFQISNSLLQQLHDNTKWAIESNTLGIITDTPIYEKNAWTGDAQLTAGVSALMFNTARLNKKLFQDMLDAQTAEGEVPHLAPSNENYGYVGKPAFKPEDCCGATPAWDAFWFITPWESYQRFGDKAGLAKVYPTMKLYLDKWIPQWTDKDGDKYEYTLTAGLGDWDTPQEPEEVPRNISLSSTAYYARFAQIASYVAEVLGKSEDVQRYEQLFQDIKRDFNARFYSSEDQFYKETPETEFTQTAQILPLAFDLVPDSLRVGIAAKLADDIQNNRGGNAYVGILGARYIMPVLTEAGYLDVAFEAATQTDYPSWGYWIEELGWTALGEHWEADTRSRNHHFFGTPVQWMYEDIAGIEPLEPGYQQIEFKPEIPAELDSVSTSLNTVMGTVSTSWRKNASGLELAVTVPANAMGRVLVPAEDRNLVSTNASGDLVKYTGTEQGRVVYEVLPGSYKFQVQNN
ncbi:glycoside hydrolase family 78 protein [Aliifodinibius sp. S!AR15-10]|uniref:family 78 glycoside hydrolase catalytic domain n=1 Tax=Aliifodinibius sp. S!AR15-10 TaxID=2950437 RepID=UPI002854700B|nr:family 78 glycoside hydrolase catalytic domain [Aliifodinibius sp. S!AR15-10]MDR8390908.1 glycoside hydrolase family 78 protein [Aliifodinibius sp. S!AR15-10]